MFGVIWDHHADPPNREPGQYGGNELPCRRSALSEYMSCHVMISCYVSIYIHVCLHCVLLFIVGK